MDDEFCRKRARTVGIWSAYWNWSVSGATWCQKPALWNEARDGVGRYQAPAGYVIKSAVPRVQSEACSSSQVNISSDKREVTLSVHVRGSGNFLDKKAGLVPGLPAHHAGASGLI